MYENFVGTSETVSIREVPVWGDSAVLSNFYYVRIFLILCTADKIHLFLEFDCVKVVMTIVIKTKNDALNTLVWSHLEHKRTIN